MAMSRVRVPLILALLALASPPSSADAPVNGAATDPPSGAGGKNVLLLCASLSGHLFPTVSIGQELKDQGYNVYLAAPYVSERMPGRIIDGTGVHYIPTGGLPKAEKSETAISKRNTAEWSTRTVSTFRMIIRARSTFYSNDALVLWSMLQDGIITEGGLTTKDEQGGAVVFKPDIVIANHFTSVQTGEHIAQLYDVPLLINSPQLLWDPMPPPPHYYPIHASHRGLKEMTFFDRAYSVLWYKLDGHYWAHHFAYKLATKKLQAQCECNMTVKEYPEPGVIRPKLVNTVVGFDYPVPVGPMVHYTGPLIYPPLGKERPLAETFHNAPDLLAWLNSFPTASVTVVSMGTHARLSERQGLALLHGLQASNRPTLWSLRKDNREFITPEVLADPKNIRFEEWLPQRAVLSHPSVEMFVGHCGAGGTHEAMYFGRPMICIPVTADQPELAVRLRASGAGLSLDVDTLDAEAVTTTLDLISQKDGEPSKYTKAAQRVSTYMRLQGGVRKASQVVAYLLAAKTSDHWILPDREMHWVLRYNVDVYAFCLAIALLFYAAVARTLGVLSLLLLGDAAKVKKE